MCRRNLFTVDFTRAYGIDKKITQITSHTLFFSFKFYSSRNIQLPDCWLYGGEKKNRIWKHSRRFALAFLSRLKSLLPLLISSSQLLFRLNFACFFFLSCCCCCCLPLSHSKFNGLISWLHETCSSELSSSARIRECKRWIERLPIATFLKRFLVWTS